MFKVPSRSVAPVFLQLRGLGACFGGRSYGRPSLLALNRSGATHQIDRLEKLPEPGADPLNLPQPWGTKRRPDPSPEVPVLGQIPEREDVRAATSVGPRPAESPAHHCVYVGSHSPGGVFAPTWRASASGARRLGTTGKQPERAQAYALHPRSHPDDGISRREAKRSIKTSSAIPTSRPRCACGICPISPELD